MGPYPQAPEADAPPTPVSTENTAIPKATKPSSEPPSPHHHHLPPQAQRGREREREKILPYTRKISYACICACTRILIDTHLLMILAYEQINLQIYYYANLLVTNVLMNLTSYCAHLLFFNITEYTNPRTYEYTNILTYTNTRTYEYATN